MRAEDAEQLVEAWQPHRLVLLHVVERPLGRAVEREDAPGGQVSYLDHHVADEEDRLVEVPFGLDLPYWVEDPDFDIDFHVRDSAVWKVPETTLWT